MARPTEHKFRYILKPGNDFAFVAKFRMWIIVSLILCTASIGALFVNKAVRGSYLNWTIDFKGGTEIVYAFHDKANPNTFVHADAGRVRGALEDAGVQGFDVSEMSWGENPVRRGVMVRVPRFGATTPEQRQQLEDALRQKYADREVQSVVWSGDSVFVRSLKPLDEAGAREAFATLGFETKPWGAADVAATTLTEGQQEYEATYAIHGLDRQYEAALEKALPEIDVVSEQSNQISAKEGDELRNSGIASLFYAFGLIVLYLAVRFDIRYAPGAIIATIHDAVMVIGIFAVTWTDVSLTSVAALLTVIGFSVNDTVVIFDRIRENTERLKDKRLERIVDISLNEVLIRSVMTSVTLFMVTLMMNIFGTGMVREFAFAMNAGIIVGAYSSLYLAPPVFLWIAKKWYSGGPAPARVRATAPLASDT